MDGLLVCHLWTLSFAPAHTWHGSEAEAGILDAQGREHAATVTAPAPGAASAAADGAPGAFTPQR